MLHQMDSVRTMTENIKNMIIFDKLKSGIPVIDAFITTIVITTMSYLFQYVNNNVSNLFIKIKTYEYPMFFGEKNSIEIEGKLALSNAAYGEGIYHSNTFSDRFKAICFYIIENMNNNNSIHVLKEIPFDCINKYDNKRDIGIYMVDQNKKFLISEKFNIYAQTITYQQEDEDNKDKKKMNKYEKIIIKLFSYKSNLNTIKEFVEDITNKYVSSIENSRENKRYIYTLIKNKYEDNRFELWNETMFLSTRRFDNVFFKGKQTLQGKIDFFLKNKDWYFQKGIPHSLGIGMYGPPGTGKTSLIKAIANYTNRHIAIISLKLIKTKKQLNDVFFEERYNYDNKKNSIGFDKKIIVFEDIDCMGDIVLNRDHKKIHGKKLDIEDLSMDSKIQMVDLLETISSVDKKIELPNMTLDEPITLDDILNLWDGIRETPGRIMIITSNHYNKLDPALIRPGRIDISLELSYVSRAIIKEMYAHLFEDTIKDEELENIQEYFYSPAEIINIYMNEDRNKERFIQRLNKNEHIL